MPETLTITPEFIKGLVVPRMVSSRKGDNGIVLVVGGNRIYHGAPLLASMAALRSGIDLVYTAVPRSNIVPIKSFSPNIIALPLPDDKLTVGSTNRLLTMLPKKPDTAAIGMGMSIAKPDALLALIRELKNDGIKLLLDASALIPQVLSEISGTDTVITPHAGEYKRIFGNEDIGKTREEQISNVQLHAEEYGITIILKGYLNIISNGKYTAAIRRANPAMTVGGVGDVLSGLVAGLLTKNRPLDASLLGIYFNGIAGNLAYTLLGLHLTATDLIENLPNAMKSFDLIKEDGF